MEIKNQNRQQLEALMVEKVMKDDRFRKRLLENPREAVEQETGMNLPVAVKLHVVEEKPDEVFLVLPAIRVGPGGDQELTEAELSNVAGGIQQPGVTQDWYYSCFCA